MLPQSEVAVWAGSGLRRGVRYRIKLLTTITDTDLNPLAAVSWTFSTRP